MLQNTEGNRLKKAKGNSQEAIFDGMTKSLAKNQDGLLFQRLSKKSRPGFEGITKKNDEISQNIQFMNIYLRSQKMTQAGFQSLTDACQI